MRGQIKEVWSETWREIWKPLSEHGEFGDDLIPDLFRELVPAPVPPEVPEPQHALNEHGEIVHPDDVAARDAYEQALHAYHEEQATYEEVANRRINSASIFRASLKALIKTENDAVSALERAYGIVASYGDDSYSNKYFLKVEAFLEKYSLRYDLRRPFSLHPTLPGFFTQLLNELRSISGADEHLSMLMHEFEDAIRDLKGGTTAGRIKTCMVKQFNLMEAISQKHPEATKQTLGDICNEIHTWPHSTLKEAAKKLYGFRSNYPGLGHGGNQDGVLREVDLRDLVAVSVLLIGFSPYLSSDIDSDVVYRGS